MSSPAGTGQEDASWAPLPLYDASATLDGLVQHPNVARMLAYWQSRRRDGRLPARRDLDPMEFRFVLGSVVIVEVQRNPLRFRYRVHGIDLVQRDGFDLTGKWLTDHPEPQYRERIEKAWGLVVESGRIMHGFRDYQVDGRTRRYEVLILPLADNGTDVDRLFVVQIF